MKNSSATTPHEAPDFATFITDIDHGSINQDLTQSLADVVRGVRETNKMGELTIKLMVKSEGGRAVVGIDIKAKKPEHAKHSTLFFIGENGELLREDPKQLKLRHLENAHAALKTVAFPAASASRPPVEPENRIPDEDETEF